MSSIRLANIRKQYGPVFAVADVSLDVEPGQFVTLLGPSGSGKTTTLRMIAGLEQPSSGTLMIGERLVFDERELVRTSERNLGMVFQSYAVWPHKTVFGNVAFPLQQRGVAQREQAGRVQEMLEMVELGGLAQRYPSELSGGQQQRVALARAMVARPEVILFDEPLSNLDAQLRESMRNLLLSLHERFHFTAVYVTHDQTEAMVLSDRVHVMNKGRIVQSGSPRELYEQPADLFVAEFIGQANVLPIMETRSNGAEVLVAGGHWLTLPLSAARNLGSLVIRPHSVRLVPTETRESDNLCKALVLRVIYLGDRAQYELDLGSGSFLQMDLVARRNLPQAGDNILVHLPPEDCITV